MGLADYLRTMGMSDGEKLFTFAQDCALILNIKFKKLTPAGELETLLFGSLLVLTIYEKNHPNKYEEANRVFSNLLLKQARKVTSQDTFDQIKNGRIILYYEEYEALMKTKDYIPHNLFSIFYQNPLSKNISHSNNIPELLKFASVLSYMVKTVEDSANKI